MTTWGRDLLVAADQGDEVTALAALNRHRVLCAHREGRWGVQGWTDQITDWIAGGHIPSADTGDGDVASGPSDPGDRQRQGRPTPPTATAAW